MDVQDLACARACTDPLWRRGWSGIANEAAVFDLFKTQNHCILKTKVFIWRCSKCGNSTADDLDRNPWLFNVKNV
ncbi:hypothetical protein FACS1894137_10650 [Spirochaetia bacterium]|nr:hypothetical protein FACS1894137_10650 [Spirochaetia bacterium]